MYFKNEIKKNKDLTKNCISSIKSLKDIIASQEKNHTSCRKEIDENFQKIIKKIKAEADTVDLEEDKKLKEKNEKMKKEL